METKQFEHKGHQIEIRPEDTVAGRTFFGIFIDGKRYDQASECMAEAIARLKCEDGLHLSENRLVDAAFDIVWEAQLLGLSIAEQTAKEVKWQEERQRQRDEMARRRGL